MAQDDLLELKNEHLLDDGDKLIRYRFNLPNGGKLEFSAPENLSPENLQEIKETALQTIEKITKFESLPKEEKQAAYITKLVSVIKDVLDMCKHDFSNNDWLNNKELTLFKSDVFKKFDFLLLEIPSEYKTKKS